MTHYLHHSLAVLILLVGVVPAAAQSHTHAGTPEKLAFAMTHLYGEAGLFVDSRADLPDGSDHSAHFNSSFEDLFGPLTSAMAVQLTSVPIPSPASGRTFTFDERSGLFTRASQSLGPIVGERAETIGVGRMNAGVSLQHLNFTTIDGVNLASIPAVFTHDGAERCGGRSDVVTTLTSITAETTQLVSFISIGLAEHLDVSVALPFVRSTLSVTSAATIQRIGTLNPEVHFFEGQDASLGDTRTFTGGGTATGVGDLIIRAKAGPLSVGRTDVAVGTYVRFPTGDAENLLGSGAYGAKPFVALSVAGDVIAPHVNVAYQWNGASVLGGSLHTGTKGDLPDELSYVVGAEVAVHDSLTLALDVLGRWNLGSSVLRPQAFSAADNQMFPSFALMHNASPHRSDLAVGFKFAGTEQMLVQFNVLVKLDDDGLRDSITPLFGLEYSF